MMQLKKILSHKHKLVSTFSELNLAKLEVEGSVILEEYCKIMQSLAIFFDKLQSEKKSFLSFVAPTILMLRQLLIHSLTSKIL